VLNSAVANATENEKADADKLVVTKVNIDGGPTQKRWLPRSMGRANRINRRTSHLTVVVDVAQD
jgi:large subunit ribosomal protein L22